MIAEYTFGNFYAYAGNKVALLAARKVIEFPGEIFNPFFVHGVEGSGRTHLLNALNNELSKKFTTDFLPVKEVERRLDEGKQFESPLIIDDVHTLHDDYKSRFEQVVEQTVSKNIQVCLSADVAPQQVRGFSPHLCSLIESGLIGELGLPELADRIDIIKRKAEEKGIIIPDDFAEALAEMITGSINMINRIVGRLITYVSLGNFPMDIDSVRSLFNEFYPRTKVCPFPAVLEKMRMDGLFELECSNIDDLRAEYNEKMRIFELKGFDVSSLKEQGSQDDAHLRSAYSDYVDQLRRLVKLQAVFRERKDELDTVKAMEIELMLFDPSQVARINELLYPTEERAEVVEESNSIVVPLGLPGEDSFEPLETGDAGEKTEAAGPPPSMLIAEPEPVDISCEQYFVVPKVQAELVEEKF
jgi:hypothetical protein